jgi:hypothetical protein
MGPDILTMVHYHTDLPVVEKTPKHQGEEKGPLHYIRVKPLKNHLSWEPTKVIPNSKDHAILAHASVPITTLPEQDGNSPSKKRGIDMTNAKDVLGGNEDKINDNRNDDRQQNSNTSEGNNTKGGANNTNEGGAGDGDNDDDNKDEDATSRLRLDYLLYELCIQKSKN